MIAVGRGFVTCTLAALLAGCGDLPAIFEDVGANPHPPELTLVGLAVQPSGSPPPRPVFLPPGTTLTINPFDTGANRYAVLVDYRDVGGDITEFLSRDLGIAPGGGGQPVVVSRRPFPRSAGAEADDTEVPLGTSGRVWLISADVPVSVEGPHRIELWAEDSKDGRSEKILITVDVRLF